MSDPDIKYFLGKLAGSMESMESDIAEIKAAQIPDGRTRMSRVEEKVQTLNVWKGTVMAIGASCVAAATWLATQISKIGGFHG